MDTGQPESDLNLEEEDEAIETDEGVTDTEQFFTDEDDGEVREILEDLPLENDEYNLSEADVHSEDNNYYEGVENVRSSSIEINDGYGEVEFIKHPKKEDEWNTDELVEDNSFGSDDGLELKTTSSGASIRISQMQITSYEDAKIIAEEVILVLEQDVANYLENAGIAFEGQTEEEELTEQSVTLREKISGSSVSISSNASVTLPGEPSKLRLFYEKGENITREDPIPDLQGVGIDEMVEVTLHRSRKWKRRGKPAQLEGFSQTKAMTFIPEDKAGMLFMTIYPQPDDYVPPDVPNRKKSMDIALAEAEKGDPLADRVRQGPQIISFSNRKKILPPLRDDYYKDETFWTGSRFKGEYRNRQFHKGHYDHPTGVQYESEWKDGHFHTAKHYGIMEYPRGDTFEGQWYQGRYVSGEITFGDGLKYSSTNWSYCELPDRRLRAERYYGMRPAGDTIYNDQYPTHKLPPGCYDVGDGIYNPKNGEIRGYDGILIRRANEKEHNWIVQNCRKQLTPEEEYIPTFNPERLPGMYMEQAQRFTIAKRRFH
ncbi:uncharacterized protein LOC118435221 [Folsomia candida]|uniref:MORN repeat-containing protein 5 n=1 Tax=Folsomia candida TaxID=158441 RepID=A0A226EWU7_FOLCA|nr:uncharacterized protein LOC118435221 [Folsomia candida]OXA61660.1 MORN repeat-containing protein 5 [Folsomia candida]